MKNQGGLHKSSYEPVQEKLSRPGNPVRKYQQTVIGVDGWLTLLVYELVECCITPVPGCLGRFFRSVFYPFIFASFSRTGKIGKNLTIHQPVKISIADRVIVEDFVTLKVKGEGEGISLHKDVCVGGKCIISCSGGTIVIGEGTVVEKECRLGTLKGLFIGECCHIGSRTYMTGASHAFDRLDVPIIQQAKTCRGETIVGDHVKIGCGVTILDGVKIGNYACIADGSLVLKDVAAFSSVQGVPAVPVN
jgi:acetyltransferase-like isoleucine patch superfamily enzyme